MTIILYFLSIYIQSITFVLKVYVIFCPPTSKMQVQLPATTKAKLESRVLVCKRKELLFRCPKNWTNGGLLSQRPSSLPARARWLFPHTIILLAFGMRRPGPFTFLAFRVAWVHPGTISVNEGDSSVLWLSLVKISTPLQNSVPL